MQSGKWFLTIEQPYNHEKGCIMSFELFLEKCEAYENHNTNFANIYGLVVCAGLWCGNGGVEKPCEAVHKLACSVWHDFAEDFSCLPNTGIWENVYADEITMKALENVENEEFFFGVLYDFFVRHVELFRG